MVRRRGSMRRRLAPYVPAATLRSFLEHIRWITTPKRVDKKLLDDYGIPKPNKSALLSALKFLDLIENDGTPTSAFRHLQSSGDEFRGNLEQVIRKAYADLFVRLDTLGGNRERIRNYFANTYSPATAKKATILFIDLCKEAGLPVDEESEEVQKPVVTEAKGVKAKNLPLPSKIEPIKPSSLKELYTQKLIESDLNITIGPGMDAEALRETRQILRDRHEFIKEAIEQLEKEKQGKRVGDEHH